MPCYEKQKSKENKNYLLCKAEEQTAVTESQRY